MDDIKTLADLLAAGAHWVAQGLRDVGRGFAAFVSRLRERFGSQLTANRATMGQFWRMSGQANAAAQLVANGVEPPIGSIPTIPIGNVSQRFLTQGVVTISDPELGEPGKPFTTSLPWQQQSNTIPTIDQLARRLNESIQQEAGGNREYRNRARRRRERADYLRQRGRDVEYDIAPFFIWRTS